MLLSLMLGEGSHQLKSIKAAINLNKSPQHLLILDLSVHTKVIKETEKCLQGRRGALLWQGGWN